MENIIIIDYNMKAINIWMLGTVLFSGLISCEMKEEIFGKDIPTETGYRSKGGVSARDQSVGL